jgi:hypothetical protein
MATTIRRLVPREDPVDICLLEAIAVEALQGLDDEDLVVSFGVWEGDDDGVRFVCKVETPPGDPLGTQPPWRWWSALFRTPEELRAELTTMIARRLGQSPSDGASDQPGATSAAAL